MVTIITNKDIECSVEDTFEMTVSNDTGFEEGCTLRMDIAENENMAPVVSNVYSQTNGVFYVTFNQNDMNQLSIGDYIYRIIILQPNGNKVVERSGNFTVKWGA